MWIWQGINLTETDAEDGRFICIPFVYGQYISGAWQCMIWILYLIPCPSQAHWVATPVTDSHQMTVSGIAAVLNIICASAHPCHSRCAQVQKMFARWVPRQLTPDLKEHVEVILELYNSIRKCAAVTFIPLMTFSRFRTFTAQQQMTTPFHFWAWLKRSSHLHDATVMSCSLLTLCCHLQDFPSFIGNEPFNLCDSRMVLRNYIPVLGFSFGSPSYFLLSLIARLAILLEAAVTCL